MGMDARIFVQGLAESDLTDELLGEVGKLLSFYRDGHPAWYDQEDTPGWTAFEGMERYFSDAYPRGNWPRIKATIEMLAARFPGTAIRYGSDHDFDADEARPVTPEMLAELDKAWSDGGYGE